MKTALAGAIAAALALAGTAHAAEHTCQWTGHDWACGDGNIVTSHYTEAAGPNIAVTPISTIDQARDAKLADPSRPR